MIAKKLNNLDRAYIIILLIVFFGVILHAPFSVFFGSIFPGCALLIKAWKEILIVIAGILALILLIKKHQTIIIKNPLIIAIGIYLFIHLLLLFVFSGNLNSISIGLAVDLRYFVFFALVYIAIKLYPDYRNTFVKVGLVGAFVVVGFALLQVFVLPSDILKYIGYSSQTIAPYLTVDQNYDFIRINSTLRGPNILGAYSLVLISLLSAFMMLNKSKINKKNLPIIIFLAVGGIISLWVSYSRSALIGCLIAVGFIFANVLFRLKSFKFWAVSSVIILILAGGLFLLKDNYFVSNVLLHENPNANFGINSNEGHVKSLSDGFSQLLSQPLGAGVGSTGSASLYTNNPEIIENQYLFMAHEAGWAGLALYLYIFIYAIRMLWLRRDGWLSLGVLAGGIGLAFVGLLLPVWTDDTISIIWWGLAAIAMQKRYN